ncbi:DNA repair endonuclease XPF mei-9 [Brevipalpus obovatus]|uniref:DNA repair endonuclease XPF mei-9 n=1 Tax=Brevipalpus obovatus TaxID=246614 RepID=UPI003D9DE601
MPLSLEFERDMLTNLLEYDCLMVTSKGLSLERVVIEFMKTYNCPSNLVLVIGASERDIEFIMGRFTDEIVPESGDQLPKNITSDFSISERMKLYLAGGILFVTTRIMVVDMLLERVPFDLITGIMVFKAHKIVDECQEAFIMRLYRMKNKIGFIKAFSKMPAALTHGFGKIDRIMRWLFLKKLDLWPRFHITVNTSLDMRAKPEVIEIRLSLSEYMKNIQFALMELISMGLKEIGRANVSIVVDIDEMTVENAISPGFDKRLMHQLDPVWHQLGSRTKKLVEDLKLHRRLLFYLTGDDCITFYKYIKSIRANVRLDTRMADWILWEPAEALFVNSKERVIDFVRHKEKSSELNAKWTNFADIIKEIKEETKGEEDSVNVIVVVSDDRTVEKLKQIIEMGAKNLLWDIYQRSRPQIKEIVEEFEEVGKSEAKEDSQPKRRRTSEPDPNQITLSQMMKQYEPPKEEETPFIRGEFLVHYHCILDGPLTFEEMLAAYRPMYFVLYDPDMEIIRQIEVYQASICSPNSSRVYFFMYDGSSEEQKYLTSLRREKEAFEALIKTKASMVVPENRDGKSGDNPDLIRKGAEEEVSSRQAGGQVTRADVLKQTVIVDMREFRSSLPSLIHRRGIDIEPVTIEIGDYILTPDLCIERKSISDLIGSMHSGRLWNQCSSMTRHYKTCIILIEFDQNKSFSFKGKYMGLGNRQIESGEIIDIVGKLVLLTIHFSQIRLIWSPSPHFSAEVFEYLKQGKDQPSVDKALAIGEQQLPAEHFMDKYDTALKNFLLNLPGINLTNVYGIMNKVKCLADLFKLSKEQLKKILNNSEDNAKVLHDCLHSKLSTSTMNAPAAEGSNPGGFRPRGVFRKIRRFRKPIGKGGKGGKKG